MTKPKVVHLSSVHDASDPRIFHKECKALVDDGYDVVLVAPARDNGKENGVSVRVIPRAANRRQRMTRTIAQVYLTALREKGVLYHFHDPELIPIGLLLKLGGKCVVYDVHEDLPRQVLSKQWIPAPLRGVIARAAEVAEALASRTFDGIVTVTPTIGRRFPKAKTIMVRNFPRVEELKVENACPYQDRRFLAAYVGGLSTIRGVRDMVEAVAMMPGRFDPRLVLAGSFTPAKLEDEIRELSGWRRVDYARQQSREGVAEILNQARVGLVLLHPQPNYLESYPVKLFEYMAVGIPVVISDFPLWRGIIEEAQCGIAVDPQNREAITQAISWLFDHPAEAEAMGGRGREAVRQCYNWNSERQQLAMLYRKLLPDNRSAVREPASSQNVR